MDDMNATDRMISEGVTFHNIAATMAYIYFGYEGMTQEEWLDAMRHVVPMQHNIENPIDAGKREGFNAKDTFIEYWIDEDDRLTQDSKWRTTRKESATEEAFYQTSECDKVARVTIRFLGEKAEAWAKLMHHITKRDMVAHAFGEYCNAYLLEYVGPIRPINVDYFGVQNTLIAFDVVLMIQYKEVIILPGERLGLISIAAGDVHLEGEVGGEA